MKIIDVIQGSPEWHKLRCGIPTASEFGRIITPAKAEYAKGAETYAAELVAASLGWRRDFQGTPDTERGVRMEKEARRWLRLHHGMKSRDVGFCLSDCGRYGASPDGLLEDEAPLEIKVPDLHTFIKWRIHFKKTGTLPDDHKAQVHGEIYVTGSQRGVFLAYPDNPYPEPILVIVERDNFTEKLGKFIERFCAELDDLRRDIAGEEYPILFPEAGEKSA